MARKYQLVYVQHDGQRWPAQIVQVDCPQDGNRLGGEDGLVDVSLLEAVVPEDNGDPNYERTKIARTEFKIVRGLSNVRLAKSVKDRVEGTWWDRAEDDAAAAKAKGGK